MSTDFADRSKVIVHVTCTDVTLKLTLTPKLLGKSLADGVLTPFLGAYNKKKTGVPLGVPMLSKVEVDGVAVADTSALAGTVLPADTHKVELFPPAGKPPAPKPAAAPEDVAAAKTAAPTPAPEPKDSLPPAPPAGPPPAPPEGTPKASNTMPRCKYGLACRIIDPVIEGSSKAPITEQHWYKFQHPVRDDGQCAIDHDSLHPHRIPTPACSVLSAHSLATAPARWQCFWVCKEGHPELGPPGMLCPLDAKAYGKNPALANLIVPCTNFDPDQCARAAPIAALI